MTPFWVQEPCVFQGEKQVSQATTREVVYEAVAFSTLAWAAPPIHAWMPGVSTAGALGSFVQRSHSSLVPDTAASLG